MPGHTLWRGYDRAVIRRILKHGEPELARTAATVDSVTPEIRQLIADMIDTMYAADGVGLAAPQIGVSLRLFVADPSLGRNRDDLLVMINPELIACTGIQTCKEGCLSLPGLEAPVPRPMTAVVQGLDRSGLRQEVTGQGLLARILQHEIDHLDGSLYTQRLRGLQRERILKKIRAVRRVGDW